MKKSIDVKSLEKLNERTQMCLMISGNMFMHVIDCMKMRIQSGRHTLGLWCTGSAMIVQRYTQYNYYAYAFLEFISSKLNSSSHWSRLTEDFYVWQSDWVAPFICQNQP